MKTLEGIIIRKAPTKARDLVCLILLRSGKTVSVYCYGGQGGGKHHKGSIMELGHMVKMQVTPNKKYLNSDLSSSREWSLIWESSAIRADINAFYFMCFIFELTAKIAVAHEMDDDDISSEYEGLFNVVSNALFHLDQALKTQNGFDLQNHLSLFLIKLFSQVGITPDYSHCIHCHVDLGSMGAIFSPQHGGFTCINCLEQADQYISQNTMFQRQIQDSSRMRSLLKNLQTLPYREFSKVTEANREVNQLLFTHFCYQFHFQPADFKTKSMLF